MLLAAVGGIYAYLTHHTPVAPVVEAATGREAAALATSPREATPAHTNALKAPIDRTHAVLEQVKGRNGKGEF